MTNFYPEGYGVELIVPFTDKAGAPIVPTSISAVLLDGFDGVIVDFGSMSFDVASGQKNILVGGLYNQLADDEVRAARHLVVTITTGADPVVHSFAYVVEAEQSLIVMTNTFQSYEAADLLALETANATGWASADETRRRAALAEAYRRITAIPMKYGFRDEEGRIDPYELTYIARDLWPEVTLDAYQAFPSHFKRALRIAQFLEANDLLEGDLIGQRHRAGIITETIGESSVTLRAGRIDYGIGSPAMNALQGYIHFDIRVARA